MKKPSLSLLTYLLPPLLLLVHLPRAASVSCYLPNGDLEPNDQPCFPQNPHSACCGGSTYVCATNNLCAHYSLRYYVVGSCTDRSWNDPACPAYCYFRDHIHNTITRCSDPQNNTQNTYCCLDGPTCNCTTDTNTQHIQDFLPPYADLVGNDEVGINSHIATSSLVTPLGATRTTSASASASTSNPNSTATDAVVTGSAVAGAGGDATSAGKDSQLGMKVGLGVGVPLGGVAVVLAVLLYRMWRRGRGRNKDGNGGVDYYSPLSNKSPTTMTTTNTNANVTAADNNPMMMSAGPPGTLALGSSSGGNANGGLKTAPTMMGMEQRASQRASVIYEAP
ncbi:hypothetical protein FQN51_008997 [Onygenales sp. PD_10]|nr:hypothetical protein FQN51_008997 [Onygenales sp. PD_10]